MRRLPSTSSRAVCLTGSAGLVSVVVLLASALSLPAQAHHKPDHDKGPNPSPSASSSPSASPSPDPSPSPSASPSASEPTPGERTATVLTGAGTRRHHVWICGQTNIPHDVCTAHWARVSGQVTSVGGAGVAGLQITVVRGTSIVETTTDERGRFSASFPDYALSDNTWTASTEGNASHAGSSSSGVFLHVVCTRGSCPV